jgi:hypothetical protein
MLSVLNCGLKSVLWRRSAAGSCASEVPGVLIGMSDYGDTLSVSGRLSDYITCIHQRSTSAHPPHLQLLKIDQVSAK